MCCSSNVRPVCLSWQENDPGRDLKENKKAVVTGWGRVKTSLKDIERKQKFGASARNLLYVRLPIANQVCEDDPDLEQYWDPETKICAGGKQGKYNFFWLHWIVIYYGNKSLVHVVWDFHLWDVMTKVHYFLMVQIYNLRTL